jgi:hypothetical protein
LKDSAAILLVMPKINTMKSLNFSICSVKKQAR